MLRSCALALAMLLLALAAPAFAQTTATGGAPASLPSGDPRMGSGGGARTASGAGADVPVSDDVPPATVAQEPEPEPQPEPEPEPEPEGPGEPQPEEPGGELQPPAGDDPVEVPGDEGTVTTGGGLPRSGLEVLQLALLGVVLVLVGARIRAVLRRRGRTALLAPDGLPDAAPAVHRERDPRPSSGADEAVPTGLLPSTATARRNQADVPHRPRSG